MNEQLFRLIMDGLWWAFMAINMGILISEIVKLFRGEKA